MGNAILISASLALTVIRLFIPTVGHSWPMVFIVVAHTYLGVMATLLWQARGKWPLGWACLAMPTIVEAAMFAMRGLP